MFIEGEEKIEIFWAKGNLRFQKFFYEDFDE